MDKIYEIRDYAKSNGVELLSKEYINTNSKLKFKCKNGHVFERGWSYFKDTQECPECIKEDKLNKIKLFAKEHGCECLSEDYTPRSLTIKCKEGHIFKRDCSSFKKTQTCYECEGWGRRGITIDYIKSEFEKIGHKLISKTYKYKKELTAICDKGHTYFTTWHRFKSNCRICPECKRIKKEKADLRKLLKAKDLISSAGYELLTELKSIKSNDIIKVRCPNNHEYEVEWMQFKRGSRCMEGECNTHRKTIEDVKKYVELFNIKCLSEKYENCNTILKFKCSKNHIFSTSWATFKGRKNKCLECTKLEALQITKLGIVLYDTYAHQMEWCEEVRRDPNDESLLQVKCINCDNWFVPTRNEVQSRMKVLKGQDQRGECRFYCSEGCKQECDIYHKKKWPEGSVPNIKAYRAYVDKLSMINYELYINQINPNNYSRSSDEYHLDHIFSVANGFEEEVSPEVIANPTNLQMLTSTENMKKHDRSDITLQELYSRYSKYIDSFTSKPLHVVCKISDTTICSTGPNIHTWMRPHVDTRP